MATFDHHYDRFLSERRLLERHGSRAAKELRLAKATAYRMAKHYIALQTTDHNRLLELIRSEKPYSRTPNPVDAWLADSFARLTAFGSHYAELIKAIGSGMTLAQFQAGTPAVFLNRKRTKRQTKELEAAARSEPAAGTDPHDLVRHWKERAIKSEALLISLRRRVAHLERALRAVQRQVETSIVAAQ